ncbi:cytochrome c-550 PedF [Porticoccus sp.]
MNCKRSGLATGFFGLFLLVGSSYALAHGDVTPQAVDTSTLEQLGDEWREENPYSGNQEAIEIGASAYNQNCARCHGLGAISGGIAPDLRALEPGLEGDEWFSYRVRNGATRNGIPYMPPFEGVLSQEALWAIRAWLETQYNPEL